MSDPTFTPMPQVYQSMKIEQLEKENERLRALIVRLEPAVVPYDRCTSHGMVKTNYKNMREGILDALLKLKETGNEN
jgi:hypothetical protein